MNELNHNYATVWTYIRRSIDLHREWIEARLGVPLSETVILETILDFQDAAIRHLLGYANDRAAVETPVARLIQRIQSAEVPPSYVPVLQVVEYATKDAEEYAPGDAPAKCTYSLDWVEGPVLIRLRDSNIPIVTLCVPCISGPDSSVEGEQKAVVISRYHVEEFMAIVTDLRRQDGKARLVIANDRHSQTVGTTRWEDLVLDGEATSLIKNDFESFFERRAWFRQMRLPHRRGYLLHGPPGNGKTSAIRAMMSSRGLTAYTLRFFDEHTTDNDLEAMFHRAGQDAPAMVLLEDIDRTFPRNGGSNTKVSLQQLLNCLDGVASGEGIITVATANDPTALDPAILRRPGRFDRVVLFPNPTPELRRRYFSLVHPSFLEMKLDEAVEESDGFSFAQLREAFILAAQAGFFGSREIELNDLLDGISCLRRTLLFGSLKASAGFSMTSGQARRG